MMNESIAMKEIHEIREQIHLETKDMTPSERAKHANDQAQKLIDEYGLKIKLADSAESKISA
jgi:hypothetical protein